MIGGLGGFILPIAFGVMLDLTGVWTSSFMLLFGIVSVSMLWMHFSIRTWRRRRRQDDWARLAANCRKCSRSTSPGQAGTAARRSRTGARTTRRSGRAEGQGDRAAQSVDLDPGLLLAFSVWMVWSVVVAKLPAIGFTYTTDQLFWLAALPGLSGATLRIFYSFMVPIFGGRLWTTLTTASLLIPAFGIGYAVQNPETPYLIFLVLALLCGLGGGNFASSMSNISFFFPKKEKGNALALNAGLGNLGVSVMQFLVPLVITAGVFGAIGGEPQPSQRNDASCGCRTPASSGCRS